MTPRITGSARNTIDCTGSPIPPDRPMLIHLWRVQLTSVSVVIAAQLSESYRARTRSMER